ncbi:MAG: hypothetical protein CMI02_08400 [Oceanospirillaceae bacterium]|nr:hypothetical protein [Oceanospirillaceae bacterium]MBT12042.1 hypothetical protein [Oceanospirillaceae bacterium]
MIQADYQSGYGKNGYVMKKILNTGRMLAAVSAIVMLSGCGADVSDETAMQKSMEESLAQCELAGYGIMGTPAEPVVVDGEAVNACVLSQDFGHLTNSRNITGALNMIQLKNSWNYQPLVWVLDGVYEFGESKAYQTLDELVAERKNFRLGDGPSSTVYARADAVVIVHRNAQLSANIQSVDDNKSGGGEWGGIIINGIGAATDCEPDAGPEALCNIEGPYGYYGGVNAETDLTLYGLSFNNSTAQGLPGLYTPSSGNASVIGEAGAETQVNLAGYEGGIIRAAVTAYAPAAGQTGSVIAYSGNTGIATHGGSWNIFSDTFAGAQPVPYITHSAGSAVVLNDYQGRLSARILHASLYSAVDIRGGDVTLTDSTFYDQFNQAGSALALTDSSVHIDNLVMQGFETCLAPQNSAAQIEISTSLLNCSSITNGTDNALSAIHSATDTITGEDAALSFNWTVSNDILSFSGVETVAQLGAGNVGISNQDVYPAAILFPQCMGAGTLSSDLLTIDGDVFQVCDLNAEISQSVTLYGSFSMEGLLTAGGLPDYSVKHIVWRLSGKVQAGSDFTQLTASEQEQALTDPLTLTLLTGSRLLAEADMDSELVIQPDAHLKVAGADNAAVVISVIDSGTGEITSGWRGITVNGEAAIDDQTAQLNIQYLRIFDSGEDGQAAVTLNNVGAGSQISFLDIYGAGSNGLSINGGGVNLDNLVMGNIAGDPLFWQNGYAGTIETAVINPGESSQGAVLHGINDAQDYNAQPRSRPVITNLTAVGFGSDNTAILLQQGSGLLLFNSVFSDFSVCLDIDDSETAALLADPADILFDGVILSCDHSLADESELSGTDYGYDVVNSSGVYEEDPVLDTTYVITGNTSARHADLNTYAGLIGDAYAYLNNSNYIGAVMDSDDDWYGADWSDSVVIAPDEACNNLGMLVGFETLPYPFDYDFNGDNQIDISESGWRPLTKVCRILGGTYNHDVTISQYTGRAGETVQQGLAAGRTLSDIQENMPTAGWAIRSGEVRFIDDAVMRIAPTKWSIKGEVHIGEGHEHLTDLTAMKENPVMLNIEAGTELSGESENSVLHITRGGALVISGEPEYFDSDDTPAESQGMVTLNLPLVIDGFGRHNQCPDADTALAATQVCNIQGKYGYFGGYDNDYGNVDIEYLNARGDAHITLNAVGRDATLQHVNLISESGDTHDRFMLEFHGGAVNLRDLYYYGMESYFGAMRWSYGYVGNIQGAYITSSYDVQNDRGIMTYIQGVNNPDDTDALPRSAPVLANISMNYSVYVQQAYDQTGISLYDGSSLNLYNSVIGVNQDAYSLMGSTMKQCLYIDGTSGSLTAQDIHIVNLAEGCAELSNDTPLIDEVPVFSGDSVFNPNMFQNNNAYDKVREGVAGLYAMPPLLSGRNPGGFNPEFPSYDVVIQGNSAGTDSGDYSDSVTSDTVFLQQTNYLGIFDYNQYSEIINQLD